MKGFFQAFFPFQWKFQVNFLKINIVQRTIAFNPSLPRGGMYGVIHPWRPRDFMNKESKEILRLEDMYILVIFVFKRGVYAESKNQKKWAKVLKCAIYFLKLQIVIVQMTYSLCAKLSICYWVNEGNMNSPWNVIEFAFIWGIEFS